MKMKMKMKMKRRSRVVVKSGEIGGVCSKCHPCKCERDDKKKSMATEEFEEERPAEREDDKKRSLGPKDYFEEEFDESEQEEEERPTETVHGEIDSYEREMYMRVWREKLMSRKAEYERIMENGRRKHAMEALKFYKKSQGAEFEIVQTLYSQHAELGVRGGGYKSFQSWCHTSFTAKPRNADSDDVKYFFAELLKDKDSKQYIAMYCSTFEPSDDEGFNHGCAVCPLEQKFHPGPNGYCVGRLPYYKAG